MPSRPTHTLKDLLPTVNDPSRAVQIRAHSQRVAEYIDLQIGQVKVTIGDQTGDTREVTIQIQDRRRRDLKGRWLVAFYVATTEEGDASATDNTVAITTGMALSTMVADSAYLVLTDADGGIVFDLQVSSPGDRWLHTLVLGEFNPFGAYAFT